MSPCVTVPLGDSALPVHACDLLSDVTVPEVGQCPCVAVTLWMVVLGVRFLLCGDCLHPVCGDVKLLRTPGGTVSGMWSPCEPMCTGVRELSALSLCVFDVHDLILSLSLILASNNLFTADSFGAFVTASGPRTPSSPCCLI